MIELHRVGLSQPGEGEVTTIPLIESRGFVAVPTLDVQNYVRAQFITFGTGFVVGMAAGALLGNLFKGRAT